MEKKISKKGDIYKSGYYVTVVLTPKNDVEEKTTRRILDKFSDCIPCAMGGEASGYVVREVKTLFESGKLILIMSYTIHNLTAGAYYYDLRGVCEKDAESISSGFENIFSGLED